MSDMVAKSKVGLALQGRFLSSSCSPEILDESTDTRTAIGRMGFSGTPVKGVEAICRSCEAIGPSWTMRRLVELFTSSNH